MRTTQPQIGPPLRIISINPRKRGAPVYKSKRSKHFSIPRGFIQHLFEIIAGVIRIDRFAIDIAGIAIATLLNLLLEPVVAGLAQRLQWSIPEQAGITVVGCNVVSHLGSSHPIVSQAHAA